MGYQKLLDHFSAFTQECFGDQLTGIYLHGSMAMGCFYAGKSDIDLIVIIERDIPVLQKIAFLNQMIQFNGIAPAKGLELSVVKRKYCRPFLYPTPFELHFSPMHLPWIQKDPLRYVNSMVGTDKDLAAHFMMINQYGKVLFGERITNVFGEVPEEDYADSIWADIEAAEIDIVTKPLDVILNLCRSFAFFKDRMYLSKLEGGRWGLLHVPSKYRSLISQALRAYCSDDLLQIESRTAKCFAAELLAEIRQEIRGRHFRFMEKKDV